MKKILIITGMAALLLMLPACATLTQLGKAARGGDIRQVEALLKNGADVNETALMGVTPLYEAVLYDAPIEIVRLLIDNGADVNRGMSNGWKPIHLAVDNGNAAVVKLLIDRGADVSFQNPHGKTPLQMAQENGQTVMLRLLQDAEEKQYKTLFAKSDIDAPPSIDGGSVSILKSDVDDPPSIHLKNNHSAYAIVVGIESYRQQLPKAEFAARDAQTMTNYLTKAMGYPEENVVTLLNDRATNVDLAKYLEKWLPNNVEPGGTVFIYYSGHGAPDPKIGSAYLVPYDGDPTFIAETGYSLSRMYDALGKLPAKEVIVALDSCFSGAGGRSVLAKGARPLVMNLQAGTAISKNMTVLAASSGDQISSTYDEKGHGLFTYFMLKGIKNEDVVNPDGSLRMDDLYGYLKPQVERIARKQYNNEQTPQLMEGR